MLQYGRPSLSPSTNDNTQSNQCDFGGGIQCSNQILGGNGNIQNNFCSSTAEAICDNLAISNGNTQNSDCAGSGQLVCSNQAVGIDNDQTIECKENGGAACVNSALGNENVQKIECRENQLIDCVNIIGQPGDRNSMNIHCENKIPGILGCGNFIFRGNDNTLDITCSSGGTFGCSNTVFGDRNNQIINCNSVGNNGCKNTAGGFGFGFDLNNDNDQRINCLFVSGDCSNAAEGNQNT